MLQVALAQVRVHARRFIAVGLAVMLGVAFLSATLMVGATTNASLGQSIGASYAQADLVVTGEDGTTVPADVADGLATVPGVDAVHGLERAYSQLATGSETSLAAITATAPDRLETATVTNGTYPSKPGEIALDETSAARLDVVPGDTVALDSGAPSTSLGNALTVSGLTAPSEDPTLSGAVQVLASPSVVRELNGGETAFRNVQLALAPGADTAAVTGTVTAALAGSATDGAFVVRTADEQTVADVAQLSDGNDVLTGILLAFAAVAVIVAALVISNTFSVLVAQRTRELALLRCIGAERRQVRTSVLVEAAIVGLVSAVLGVLLAVGVMAVLVGIARQTTFGSFAVLAVPPSAVITGIVVGVLMTLLAALVPARAATRVAPLAALRPTDPIVAGSGSGRVCLSTGLAALTVGGALGAQTARTSFDRALDKNYAVDLEVAGTGAAAAAPGAAPPRVGAPTLLQVDGVRTAVELTPVMLTSADDGGILVYAADPEEIAGVLRSQGTALTDGMVLAPQTWTQADITLEGAGGPSTLPVTATGAGFFQPLITTATAEELGGTPSDALSTYLGDTGDTGPEQSVAGQTLASYLGTTYWLKLDDGLDAAAVVDVQSRIVAATGVSGYQVTGAAIERVAYNEIIDVMLLIVTALLAVAVLIALIGVANTLSLSVLERRRENSLLRALGLTRAQLRGMLAVEAVLVAGVAALLGSGLGILYGWLGAQSALGGIAAVSPSVPFGQIGAVLAVAVGAGLLASVLPARRAARLSPVSGLASD